jgi:hypothetical protein
MQVFSSFSRMRRFASGLALFSIVLLIIFANVVNGQGTLSAALDAIQQSTVTFMKKQGFTVNS